MNSTAEGRNMEYTKSPLELLDELDAFRRGHQDERLVYALHGSHRCQGLRLWQPRRLDRGAVCGPFHQIPPGSAERCGKQPILNGNQGGTYLRRVKKHCNNCRHSYWQKDRHGVSPKTGRVQLCRHPVYRSPAYTEEMMLADRALDHCRFWAPRPGKGSKT